MAGDRGALARLLTAVENRTPLAEAALRRLYPVAGKAHLVGITGPPGSGKSTLVAALIGVVRAAGRAVAVVAVDPSSPITGGALLGDRVRMQSYAGDRDVFIRSMASRGHAGRPRLDDDDRRRGARCGRVRSRAHRDGRDRPERGRGRGRGRHDRRPRGARDGRRGPGDQGRPARGRGPGRREQGRQARGAADRRAAARDARPDRRADAHRSTDTEAPRGPGHDGLDRRGRARAPGRAGPAPDAGARTRAVARGGPGRRRRSGPSWASGCARRWSRRNALASTEAVLEDVAAHRLDPYAAADRLLRSSGAG